MREKGIKYVAVAAGDSLLGLGGVGGVILHPSRQYVSPSGEAPHGLNNGSVVLHLSYGKSSILLTGDIEHETDPDLLRWTSRLESDVLKAAHHGSRTSSTRNFLAGVKSKLVLVSCGVKNKFRHPVPEVIDRYKELDIEVVRTDRSGAIYSRYPRMRSGSSNGSMMRQFMLSRNEDDSIFEVLGFREPGEFGGEKDETGLGCG